MDVTTQNFWETFPEVVQAIAEADYVAFDLEMTGIISKEPRIAKLGVGDVYERARKAAKTHQIIQIGLTCVHYVDETDVYESKTYNFYINPMFTEIARADKMLGTVLDRHICFSYSSYQFLNKFCFQFDKAFQNGVTYLSHQEARELGKTFLRPNRKEIQSFDLSEHDEVVQSFYHQAEEAIRVWLGSMDQDPGLFYVNIPNPYGGKLTGFHISLVFHLVETQFPQCRAQPRHDDMFVQVTLADVTEKEKMMKHQLKERKEAVVRQTGFRYLIDALAGNLFTEDLHPEWMVEGTHDSQASKEIAARLEKYEDKLTLKRPIVVGHNQFYDICFLYQTFMGDLPSKLEDFRSRIHALFPRMVDTKFLATPPHYHSMMADENLSGLFDVLKDQEQPVVVQDPLLGPHMYHQAGYDSWMTALILARKAWNLHAEAGMEKDERRDYHGNIVKMETADPERGCDASAELHPRLQRPGRTSTAMLETTLAKMRSSTAAKVERQSPVKNPATVKVEPSATPGRWLGTPPSPVKARPSTYVARPEPFSQLRSDPHYWGRRETATTTGTRSKIAAWAVAVAAASEDARSLLDASDSENEDEFGQRWPPMEPAAAATRTRTTVRATTTTTPLQPPRHAHPSNPLHSSFPSTQPALPVPWLTPLLAPVQPGAAILTPAPFFSLPVVRSLPGPAAPVTSLLTATGETSARERLLRGHRLPEWEGAFWRRFGNRLRVGTSGSLDLEREIVEE